MRSPLRRAAVAGLLAVAVVPASPVAGEDGLRASLTPTPAVGTAAQFVNLELAIDDPDADSVSLLISYGDGQVRQQQEERYCQPSARAGKMAKRIPLRHPYRYPGTYSVVVEITTDGCGGAEPETTAAATQVVVLPGAMPSNGPSLPQLHVGRLRRDGLKVATSADLADNDGWPALVRVEWGDGTHSDYRNDGCTDPVVYWPTGRRNYDLSHQYRRAGVYHVRVLASSAGCGGKDVQRAEVVKRVVQVKPGRG